MTRLAVSRRAALAAFAAAMAAPAALARPFDEVEASGVLRVALYRGNAPFSDDAGGKPVGIDVDLAGKIADKLGVKPDRKSVV